MAHYVPKRTHYYVESITIVNGGSGFTTTPTLTITGGGGTGATAEAQIFNGSIVQVTVTNIGDGYKSVPTVTVTGGGGSNVELSVVLDSASSTYEEFKTKEKLFVSDRLPEHVQNNFPKFQKFLETYYQFVDEEYGEMLHPHLGIGGTYQDNWIRHLAADFPRKVVADKELFYQRIRDIYEAKGTVAAVQAFFRSVYGEEVEVEKPQDKLLIASGGHWDETKVIRVVEADDGYSPLDLIGRRVSINYHETIGTATFIKSIRAVVKTVSRIAYLFPRTYDIGFDFVSQSVTTIPGPGGGAVFGNITVDGNGAITSVPITNGGAEYLAAPDYVLTNSTYTTEADLSLRVEDGELSEVVIVDGGSGYTAPEIVLNVDPIRTYITMEGEDVFIAPKYAYLGRVLKSISNITYAGSASDAGFEVGQLYTINEAGTDNLGYATDYFSEDYVFIGGINNAVIRVKEVSSAGVPTSFEVLNCGSNFFNVTTTISISSPSNEIVSFTLTTGYFFQPPGMYLNERGFLSDVNVLQDNNRYQAYSYIIKSGLSKPLWDHALKETVHPAGLAFFGDINLKTKLDFESNIGVRKTETDVTKILTHGVSVFAPAIGTTSLAFISYSKPLTETVTVSNPRPILQVDLVKTETVTASESDEKSFTKGLTDTVSATDSLDRQTDIAVTYVRGVVDGFADTLTASENLVIGHIFELSDTATSSDAPEISFTPQGKTDSSTVSDSVDDVSLGKNISDNNSATESINLINTGKIRQDTATATESKQTAVDKELSDTATPTDDGTAVNQDYVEGAYFSDIYIGSGATF